MSRTVLITGGAGYVGSHTALHLQGLGWRVVVLDDLSTGHRRTLFADWHHHVDLLDRDAVFAAVGSEPLDGIVHCGGRIVVPESVRQPVAYWRANVVGSVHLVEAAVAAGGVPIVFSSSAAVYGAPDQVPVPEGAPLRPTSPYGYTKLVVEQLLADAAAEGVVSVCLRYFNAAGADPGGRSGELHDPETHLVPNAILAGLRGGAVTLFGTDWPTPDGTCIRDYVHVMDVARAHEAALRRCWGGRGGVFNLGSGAGASVREVIDAVAAEVGGLDVVEVGRRAGDPPVLIADAARAREELGWTPELSDIGTIVSTAAAWHRRAQ